MKPGAYREEEQDGGTPQGVQILAFLCGLVVAYLGFKSTWQDFSRIHKLHHLDRFVETSGKFLQVKVRRDSTGAADDFYPDVLYEYFVDGKSIWGWRLSYEEEPKPKAYWEGRLAGYAQGAAVPVFYSAQTPKDSILEKKHDGLYRIWLKMSLGAGFLFAGLVLAMLPLSGWIRKPSPRK
ncbi:MAG TPA: DUF3592 domain-containing protein [Fibrobacteria bacterium]|nr:DUF3592 domain-containing protein [Fibrobacteria bacterium]